MFDKDALSEMVIVNNLGVKVTKNDQFIISDRTVALRERVEESILPEFRVGP